MDAIVTAGGIPQPGEPLYEYTQGMSKAMLDVAGKPMIQWVLDALSGAKLVERVVIMGLPPETDVSCPKVVSHIPNQGDMIANIRGGVLEVLRINPQADHVLLVSSDIPAITPEMVDWVVNATMQTEKRFPTSHRSYVKLKDVEVCGGDMNVVATRLVTSNDEIWGKLVAARKNALKQAALLGYDTLFLLLFRAITLDAAIEKAAQRLHLTGRAILSPYAEIGMDVDKPHQLEILRADLAQRQAA
jgi:GTP:adenosylcobinamide-phosphate guanylyltransferase